MDYVTVMLANGKKYKIRCLFSKSIGSLVICELAKADSLDFGLLFWKNKMYLYHYPESNNCKKDYSPLDLLFINRLCVKEINNLEGIISKHYYEAVS